MGTRMRHALLAVHVMTAALMLVGLLVGESGAQPSSPGCTERLPNERTSMELRGADIQTTLRLLAQRYRINMLITDEVGGNVTLSFYDVPVRDVFATIIEAGNLRCVARDGLLRVSTNARFVKEEDDLLKNQDSKLKVDLSAAENRIKQAEVRAKEADSRSKLAEAEGKEIDVAATKARGPLKDEWIKLKYAEAEDVAKTLQDFLGVAARSTEPPRPGLYAPTPPTSIPDSSGGPGFPPQQPGAPLTSGAPGATGRGPTVAFNKATNTIFIRYFENDLKRIIEIVERLDIPRIQVQIAAQIVVTSRNALEQLGVQWGAGAVSTGTNPTLVGTGFTQGLSSASGLPPAPAAGFTPTIGNTGIATGVPLGGNLINLPVSFLPTTANPALGLLFGIVGRNFNVNLAIQALEVQGRARTLSEPKIVTVENAKAVISRGFEVPYVSQTGFGGTQVQFKDALLKLEVTPSVIRDPTGTRIRMKVLVENNEPDFVRTVLGNPPIFKRRGETEVVVREGERLVMGGALVENDNSTVREVPLLGRLPVLGWLFKSRELSNTAEELLLILTPSVLQATTAAR